MVKIVVVGAGIIGLSSAYCIQQKYPDIDITIITEKLSPYTTGDGAAGVWGPYLLGDNLPENIEKWSGKTHELFRTLWNTPEGGEMGISLIPCYRVCSEPLPEPEWKNVVFGFRNMTPAEFNILNTPKLRYGNAFTTFTCECSKFLPVLRRKFEGAGGNIIQKHVSNLEELGSEFDIVLNCTGLGSNQLVNDKLTYPIRGQILRVKAPGVFYAVIDDSEDGGYIIPNQERVILGGTHQAHDWNLTVDDNDTKFITKTCYGIMPKLKAAPVIDHFVGLRPGRPTIRLELESMLSSKSTNGNRKPFVIIHNYGHGGSGVTLFWGCALEACELVGRAMNEVQKYSKSKL